MERIKWLQKQLHSWKVEGCLIENTVDLFYLTGFELSAGSLLVSPRTCRLFIDGRYLEMVQEKGSLPFAGISALEKHLQGKKKIAFDSRTTCYERYVRLKSFGLSLKPIPGLLKEARGLKDAYEIELMKKSGHLAMRGIEHLERLIKPGIMEKDLARAYEFFCIENGADKLAFEPIIAFGQNTALPHHRAGSTVLKSGDLVLIDVGVTLNRYCSDLTRVVFFGKKDPQLKNMYLAVRAAHQAALEICRAGTKISALEEAAYVPIREAGLEKLLVHSLGHGVGLEVHEFPRVSKKGEDKDVLLESGMTITIEPGLYLPGKGGVRYEDTVIIREDSYEFAL